MTCGTDRLQFSSKRGTGLKSTCNPVYVRGGQKQCRKRYGSYDSRGRLAGNARSRRAPPSSRPAGDWEADTIVGPEVTRHGVVSLVERKTGDRVLGKRRARTVAELNRRTIPLLRQQPHPVHTLPCDNGTAFHRSTLEAAITTQVYFATPHQAWERGTNENTNGLVRQYIPKGDLRPHEALNDATPVSVYRPRLVPIPCACPRSRTRATMKSDGSGYSLNT